MFTRVKLVKDREQSETYYITVTDPDPILYLTYNPLQSNSL